jgi:hypothetical protein
MRSEPEPLEEFDQIERVTQRVVRGALVGFPTWILLLWLLPLTGLGVMPCFFGASLLAAIAVVVAERRHRRRHSRPAASGAPRTRRPMSPLMAAGLTLAGVALLAYVLFVIRAA